MNTIKVLDLYKNTVAICSDRLWYPRFWTACIIGLSIIFVAPKTWGAEDTAVSYEYSLDDDALFIGHSLVGPHMPHMVEYAVQVSGGNAMVSRQIINGATIQANWQHSATAEGVDSRVVLPSGDYEVVVMTEAIPLINHLEWSDTYEYATKFYDLATTSNPNTRVYIYESWHSLLSGTGQPVNYDNNDHIPWRERLDQDLELWEGIVNAINETRQNSSSPEAQLIPVGQAMAALYDAIGADQVPGISDISEFFGDHIHLNALGNYFLTMVQYSTIYGRDPENLPAQFYGERGERFDAPSPALADVLQDIAWGTVSRYLNGDEGANIGDADNNHTDDGHDGQDLGHSNDGDHGHDSGSDDGHDQGSLLLKSDDIIQVGVFGWVAPTLKMRDPAPNSPIVGPEMRGNAVVLLRRLAAQGRAAGLEGVVYDNRDRGHSRLAAEWFPNLTHLHYGSGLQAANADLGLGGVFLLPMPVLGNSSTAVTSGHAPRSLPRLAMTTELGPAHAFRTYASNHLYVYPEHQDHDDQDLFPANWPYMVISQGSSGSDQAFLQALALALAALMPETRSRLEAEKLLGPTMQLILRRTQKGLYGPESYLGPAAHPSVFDEAKLSPERMVTFAAALKPEDIPPMVRLRVLEEDFGGSTGLAERSERLFTTPSAIARLWRGPEHTKKITLSAAETKDSNGRKLSFHWVLLRGDPEKVTIKPQGTDKVHADITVAWHDPYPVTSHQPRQTSRVDIAVIAWNGVQYSAPAILSVDFPAHQIRSYSADGSGQMQLAQIDYDALGRGVQYDPLLYWSAPWYDEIDYDAEGGIAGWTRHGAQGETHKFDATGMTETGMRVTHFLEGELSQPELKMLLEAKLGDQ